MSALLKVENLSHRYATAWAIRDINIEINQKGVVGLLGSNGAGKSTTMNIICGVLNQTEGEVYVNGIDKRKDPRGAKRELGFLPQTPPLYADFTVNEYLTYAATLRFIERIKIKSAVEEAMEKTGITHFSSRLIKNLSGGYRQRVGIAQAIIHKPGMVILDEPTNGLDPNQVIEARKLIREIANDHLVLLSSHVLSEINLLCREIIMIEGGRIVFADSIDAFNSYAQPQTIFVKMDNLPAASELQRIPGITKVEAVSPNSCHLYFSGSSTITQTIIRTSIENNWGLSEISLEKSLLDDVFKQLSHSQQ
ncbi:ABC transporter ATP-binding protein [Pseudobacter ginsenosidimutans]|uniref:ABC-2 type transport system ATP-binding protein n=1 Tax=Pseudobacter ginsenosidimutans TaxID=661488 RepID=A0A4Q7N1M2_9BACT|nr:ABC transporter ATP-binding protein [Pseudobacter ginsenosidimutans]QEC43161.1 ABC transporter ATP-binding protein [Pseudobacter ginsenosidimutans]RZS74519.1 ABC-2 type transport system ATP-binding protein [Pseudobacter ginsenosidimutans]